MDEKKQQNQVIIEDTDITFENIMASSIQWSDFG